VLYLSTGYISVRVACLRVAVEMVAVALRDAAAALGCRESARVPTSFAWAGQEVSHILTKYSRMSRC
jgi:hypothetical protein